METQIADDIRRHLKRVDKQHQQHTLVGLLKNLGVTTKTMSQIFLEDKEISRGTVYNIFGSYVRTVNRKVENKLLKTLKIATEQAILVANMEKNKHKLNTLNTIKEAIVESKKYLNNLDEMDVSVFELGVLEENKEIKDKKDEYFIENYIEYCTM